MAHSFFEYKKNSTKSTQGMPTCKVGIMGDCATQHLSLAIKGAAYQKGIAVEILDLDYDQMEAQAFDKNSALFEFAPDFVVVLMCTERLYDIYCETNQNDRHDLYVRAITRMETLWEGLSALDTATILQCNFSEYDDRVFGDYANVLSSSFLYQVRKANTSLMDSAGQMHQVRLIDVNGIQLDLGRNAFSDPRLYHSSKLPFTLDALCKIAEHIADTICVQKGFIKKCIVLDLDNTLWGGVVGDDGLSGIQIGDLGSGHAFSSFQVWLRELKRRGIILTVCSKNEEDIAKEPFEKHPDMVLKLEDIALFVANWHDKASNITHIQETLNIGMDSIVFIDDNPFERNSVSSLLPEVEVPDMPADPSLYVEFLESQNLFSVSSFSREDEDRSNQYLAEGRRRRSEAAFDNFEAYLKSLDMVATVTPFDAYHVPRISQLSQRSNQFNLRTQRYSEADVQKMMSSEIYETMYFTLSDQFGEHGLVALVVLEHVDKQTAFIDTLVMSCRVLKRGMEEFVFNKIIETARKLEVISVVGEYLPTKKNILVKSLYTDMGFTPCGEGCFSIKVKDYEIKNTYVKEA